MSYQPTWESVSQHPVPGWFDDAKLGIFLHWGLYSVPGWAPQVPDIQQMLREQGPNGMLRNNPYAEWYLNTMRIQGSPTWEHHRQTYGPDFPYDGFASIFNEHSSQADLDALAEVCVSAGAQYVVLTTKHHDGFCMFDTKLTDYRVTDPKCPFHDDPRANIAKGVFDAFIAALPPLAIARFTLRTLRVQGEVAYITWSAGPELPLGTDTFVVRQGRITAQTFAMVAPPLS